MAIMIYRWAVAIVSLPLDIQRNYSLLKEQEAFAQTSSNQLFKDIRHVLDNHATMDLKEGQEMLTRIRTTLIQTLRIAEEKVSIAEHAHLTVEAHHRRLAEDLGHFEEEMKLAKFQVPAPAIRQNSLFHHHSHPTTSLPHQSANASEKNGRSKRKKTEDKHSNTANSIGTVKKRRSVSSSGDSNQKQPSTHKEEHITTKKRNRPASHQSEESKEEPAISTTDSVSAEEKAKIIKRQTYPPTSPAKPGDAEPTYCYCNQISFGEMVACDNQDCELEWFHYDCVGLKAPPKGKWYCPECQARMKKESLSIAPNIPESDISVAHPTSNVSTVSAVSGGGGVDGETSWVGRRVTRSTSLKNKGYSELSTGEED